ncbi:hypothetical protein BB559_006591 [Furculomyces boomerangus]|uniref:Reverse transcriptase domain-containing protein n=1 Tax=Furculomyces boomerangus TaxID=61424 RepID=A0A2T9Y1M3_9FUNG|nr:hypothetical protein BB559_006591 [Furculomyces boomerangus]
MELENSYPEKYSGLLIKIDQKKAYNKIGWNFLWKTMEKFGFNDETICVLDMVYIETVKQSINLHCKASNAKVNTEKSSYAKIGKPSIEMIKRFSLKNSEHGFKYLGIKFKKNCLDTKEI